MPVPRLSNEFCAPLALLLVFLVSGCLSLFFDHD